MDVAEQILGWYVEGAVHLWPEGWKEGKLAGMDLVFFLRYEWIDTQWRMPDGVAADPRGRREVVTAGFTWFILPNLVAKVDYQWLDDDTPEGLDNLFNIGLGWSF